MELNLGRFPCSANTDKTNSKQKCEGSLVPVLIVTDMQRGEHINKDFQKITWQCTICGRKVNG
jgi:hypothetical protein